MLPAGSVAREQKISFVLNRAQIKFACNWWAERVQDPSLRERFRAELYRQIVDTDRVAEQLPGCLGLTIESSGGILYDSIIQVGGGIILPVNCSLKLNTDGTIDVYNGVKTEIIIP